MPFVCKGSVLSSTKHSYLHPNVDIQQVTRGGTEEEHKQGCRAVAGKSHLQRVQWQGFVVVEGHHVERGTVPYPLEYTYRGLGVGA